MVVWEAGVGGLLAEVSYEDFSVTVAYDLAAKDDRRADREGATRRVTERRAAIVIFVKLVGDSGRSRTAFRDLKEWRGRRMVVSMESKTREVEQGRGVWELR